MGDKYDVTQINNGLTGPFKLYTSVKPSINLTINNLKTNIIEEKIEYKDKEVE